MNIPNGRPTDAAPEHPAVLPVRRDLRFNLPVDRIGDWHTAAGPQFTAFLNTFSIVLPVGERYFIDSVRKYRERITEPQLKQAVIAFIGQEAMHGREHEEYNQALFAKVTVARQFERVVARVLGWSQRWGKPSLRLSTTIALEHFTALLAHGVLSDPRISEGAEPRFVALWRWHALEETEHKAVAFDVWQTVMGRGWRAYLRRCLGMLAASLIFWSLIIPAHLLVLHEQRMLLDASGWRKFFRYTFGEIGLVRKMILPWADYFRPGFHPWDHDNRECLAEVDSLAAQYRAVA